MEPEENPVLYYTLTSIKEGRIASAIRTSMVKFATSFIGNPYVWGGTSLTQGADCSGFVQSIYAQYGYSIPRVAADQAQYGKKIQVSDAQPGDLIFYARDGEIYHVVMYIGDGKVVEGGGDGNRHYHFQCEHCGSRLGYQYHQRRGRRNYPKSKPEVSSLCNGKGRGHRRISGEV